MKKIILIELLSFALLLATVRAESLHISVEPSEVWTGDSVNITCWYSETNTTPITPFAYIEHVNQHSMWRKDLTQENVTHFTAIFVPPLLGSYKAICSNGTINSSETVFKTSKLTLLIKDYPKIAYLGEKIVTHVRVIKTADVDETITSNVHFDVILKDKKVQIDDDATYCLGGEWTITTKEISSTDFKPSTYPLIINASYMGESSSSNKSIQIKNPVEIELMDVDKTEVLPEDNITISLKAVEKGNPIPLKDLQLKFQISDKECAVLSLSQIGNKFDVVVSAPYLPTGSYNMSMKITYKDYVWEQSSVIIDYVVPVTVNMKDSSNRPVAAQFRFLKDGEEKKKFITDSSGSFSGYILPGTYDVELTLPKSKLILYGVVVNDFDNPIRFDYPSTDVGVAGIGVADIYVFEVALSYSHAYLELKYDSSKVLNEEEITLYKCENWNFGRKICNSDWKTLKGEVDTIRDLVRINTSTLSAYLVGYKKSLALDFDTDKDDYYLSDIMRITGIVEDEDGKPVPDVEITATIPDTKVSASGKTDNGGVFAFELQGPDQEGEYEIIVNAEKPPFSPVNSSKTVKFVRSSQLSLLVPESVQIRQGETHSMWITIVNIGQTDFSNLTLSMSGIPEEYYTLPEIGELKAGEEEKVSIDFKIPENAGITGYNGRIKVNYDDKVLEEQFILTILSLANETANQTTEWFRFPSLSLPTAKIVLPGKGNEVIILALSSILVFSFTVFLKKRKVKSEFERKNVKNLLLDIKREVERFSTRERVKKSEMVKGRMKKFRKALKKRKTK